jgi:hypothetical protein
MEVFGHEVTDSRESVVHQGPLDRAWTPSGKLEELLEESGAALMLRQSKTVLRLKARGHTDAFREVGEDEHPRVEAEHVAYRTSLCEAHIPVINELIQRYRLTSYDYFAYEVSPWDVPVWQLGHAGDGLTAVLLTYKRWDEKPVVLEDGPEPGAPPVARPFEFVTGRDLEAIATSEATPGELPGTGPPVAEARRTVDRRGPLRAIRGDPGGTPRNRPPGTAPDAGRARIRATARRHRPLAL